MNKRPMPQDYAPYHAFLASDEGITDYMEGRFENPHGTTSVAAQAWDRGSEYAHRVCRYNESR
jgi:hypothetical protein